MSTILDQQAGTRRRRRIHSDEFKANAVASCMQPGMSMAAVAMAQGVNANLLRRWVRDAEMNSGTTVVSATTKKGPKAQEAKTVFVPVSLPVPGPACPSPALRDKETYLAAIDMGMVSNAHENTAMQARIDEGSSVIPLTKLKNP